MLVAQPPSSCPFPSLERRRPQTGSVSCDFIHFLNFKLLGRVFSHIANLAELVHHVSMLFMPLIIVRCSLSNLFLGAAISFRTPAQHDFSLIIFVLNVFTIALVHCAGNVVNTYFDYVKGIDNRKSDDRTLVDHILTIDEVNLKSMIPAS